MSRFGFFYRINNLLIVAFIIFLSFVFYTKTQNVYSQNEGANDIVDANSRINAYLINRELRINLEPSEFTVNYLSDGFSGEASGEQKQKFLKSANGKSELNLIPIPINFKFDEKNSKLVLPGELVYPAIPKTSAPSGFQCVEKGSAGDNLENQRNCFFNVTQFSIFSQTVANTVTIGDVEYKVEEGENIFSKLIDAIINVINYATGVVTNAGLVDQSRTAVGTIRIWGDDNFQQIADIIPSERGILHLKASVVSTGVNVSEGLFPNDLNPSLDTKVTVAYKQPNVVRQKLFDRLFGLVPDNNVVGAGEIYDPFTSSVDQDSETGFKSQTLAEAFLTQITKSNRSFTQKQNRLSPQIAIRPIQETEEYNAKYVLCEAFRSMPERFSYLREYPNPIRKPQNKYIDQERRIIDPEYVKWENYNNLSTYIKKCIDGIAKHIDSNVARNCAISMAENPNAGCDEFSVEEKGLRLSLMERTFPAGLGAYFQNSYLNTIRPSNKGPYINYLSASLCAQLTMGYNIKPGASYMYYVGTEDGKSGLIRDSRGRVLSANVLNQYCLIGGVMSNFSWAMINQIPYFGARSGDGNTFSLPKEALTCDKKEVVYFGATLARTNIPSANGEPVYVVDDNTRKGSITNDEVIVYRGYNAYPLTAIMNTDLKGKTLYKYNGNFEIFVLNDRFYRKPKYFITSVNINTDTMGLFLCKFPLPSLSAELQSNTQRSYCVEVHRGRFILAYGAALAQNEVRKGDYLDFIDTVTVIFNDVNTPEGQPLRKQYRYIDIIDENDIAKSILSPIYNLFDKTVEINISTTQMHNGSLAVGYIIPGKNSINEIAALSLNPTLEAEYEFNQNGKLVGIKRGEGKRILSDNLCDIPGGNYCAFLNFGQPVLKVEITQAPSGGLYMAGASAGKGVIFPVDPTGTVKSITPFVFGYKKQSKTIISDFDPISAFRVDEAGDFHIFLSFSGFYLHILSSPLNYINSEIAKQTEFLNTLHFKCGLNCLPTIQMQFDPDQFTTDCTDYKGSGVCGAPKMNKLGPPRVADFEFTALGEIRARYTHSGLDKALLESTDFIYSMSGVYQKLEDEGIEVSNVYLPNIPFAKPIRYFNYSGGGLQIGKDVIDVGGDLRENLLFNQAGISISPLFGGYNRSNKIEKIQCLQEYAKTDSSGDLFLQLNGITPIQLNPYTPVDRVVSLINPSGSLSSSNSGEFCEETWCIPDEVPFVGNPEFANDTNDSVLKRRIAEYLNRDISWIDRLCKISSEKGVSCAFMAAIWKVESSASTREPQLTETGLQAIATGEVLVPGPELLSSSPQFGCMLYSTPYCKSPQGQRDQYCQKWYTFENQVKCAVNSIYNRYNEYVPGVVITGPSDRISKPYLTNTNRGGGSCIPATRFSYVMQKYTPIDKRINNDNQCNTGLVVRDKGLQELYCDGILPSKKSRDANGVSVLPEDWGKVFNTRPTMQKALIAMDPRLRADNNLCFPNKNQTIPDNTTGNVDIAKVLTEYDTLSFTQVKGQVKLNLKAWGTDDAAGNVYMALKLLNNGKLEGVHVIPPGQEFSFNDTIGNPSPQTVEQLKEIVSQTKVPWNQTNFKYNGSTVVGGGWCELATGIRMSAEMLRGSDGKVLQQSRFYSPSEVNALKQGDGTGFKGDINHWTHGGATLYQSYNNLLVPGFGSPLQGPEKFVAIWVQPLSSNRASFNDADLVLRNPYPQSSGIDMIITIQLADNGIITIETMFGKKRSDLRTTDVCAPTSMVAMNVRGPSIQRDSDGRIIGGTALAEPAAESYEKARQEIKEKTGEDLLGTVADMLRNYAMQPTNRNSIDKSWHKTGRAVDLNLESGLGNICRNSLNCTGRVRDGSYWRLYYKGVDITAILEKHGWSRIPDQCSSKPGPFCAEWWHYEFRGPSLSWEQAMLQVWRKDELKSRFPDVNWDSISCVDESRRSGPR